MCNKSCPGGGLCKICLSAQNLDSMSWYSDYSNPLASKLVKSLKFSNTYAAAELMARTLRTTSPALDSKLRVSITSAPTAGRRSRARGWDQARLIATALAKDKKLPYKSLLLRTSSFDQIGSTKRERVAASKNFFKAHRKALIKDSVVILVDDVVTTGSTLDSAAGVLKSAGAKEVHGIVFARQGLDKL